MAGKPWGIGVRPLPAGGFHTLATFKIMLDLGNDLIVISIASLQLGENSFQVIKLSGHLDSPKLKECQILNGVSDLKRPSRAVLKFL
jgi:hypothetical protein